MNTLEEKRNELEEAVIAIHRILSFSQYPYTEENLSTASMIIRSYEEQNKANYIMDIEQKLKDCRKQIGKSLSDQRESLKAELIEAISNLEYANESSFKDGSAEVYRNLEMENAQLH